MFVPEGVEKLWNLWIHKKFCLGLQENKNGPPTGKRVRTHFTGERIAHFTGEIGGQSITFLRSAFCLLPTQLR